MYLSVALRRHHHPSTPLCWFIYFVDYPCIHLSSCSTLNLSGIGILLGVTSAYSLALCFKMILQCKFSINSTKSSKVYLFELIVLTLLTSCRAVMAGWLIKGLRGPLTTNVTKFWKITLMGAPEIIRIFELTTVLLTSQKHILNNYFYTFPCNSKHFYCIGNINEEKAKFSSCFSELNI